MGKNVIIGILCMLMLLLICVYSCKKKESSLFLNLETADSKEAPATLWIAAEGGSESFVIKSNGSWKTVLPEIDDTWLSIDPAYGNGDGSFSVNIKPNISLSKRETQLSITLNGYEKAVLKIIQENMGPDFMATPSSLDVIPNAGGEIEFTIESNVDWNYSITDGDWLVEKSRTSTNLILEASENILDDVRLTTVLFTLPSFEGLTQEVKISQSGLNDEINADLLLDILFKADGTASDLSSFKHNVSTIAGLGMSTVYSNTYQRYIARFNHTPGTDITAGFYKFDYSSNQNFKDAISDGHTLEAMFMLDFDNPIPNAEIKMFSSHQAGGTGIMVANNSRGNAITFLPHVGGGWIWANSNIVPQRGKYYHVVGVWNKQEGKAFIYVDGELKSTVNASGEFSFPATGTNWFGIGADPAGVSSAHTGWKGDVVISRIYDKPFEQAEVEMLWTKVKDFKPSPDDIQVSNISLPSKRLQPGDLYTIGGEGFVSGDKIRIMPISGVGGTLCDARLQGSSLSINIPTGLISGQYRFFVVRGNKELDIGFVTLTVVTNLSSSPKVIAHRGYWKTGAPQNSLASLVRAQDLDVYGSEFDVWITTDDELMVNHDGTIDGVTIEKSTYDDLKDITLSNGERLPTLQEYLDQGKKDPTTKLILEIKPHSNSINNDRVSIAVVNMVRESGVIDQVEYISFSLDICKKILELQPGAIVAYVNGDRAPKELHQLGIKGIDYNISVIRQNKDWIRQAQELKMTVNVWTVNSETDLQEMINEGVDFITTDEPVLAKRLIVGG